MLQPSNFRWWMLIGFGGNPGELRSSEASPDIPCLGSRPLLTDQLGAVLDLPGSRAYLSSLDILVPFVITRTRNLAMCINDFGKEFPPDLSSRPYDDVAEFYSPHVIPAEDVTSVFDNMSVSVKMCAPQARQVTFLQPSR